MNEGNFEENGRAGRGRENLFVKFGEYMRRMRETAGLTQTEAGKRIGVTRNAVQNWEYGTKRPDPKRWGDVVRAYGLKESDFLANLRNLDGGFPAAGDPTLPEELFRPDALEKVRNLTLTAEEQYVLGMEEIYGDGGIPPEVPDKLTPFRFISARNSMRGKTEGYRSFVVDCVLEDPAHEPFSIRRASPAQIARLLEEYGCAGEGYFLLKRLAVLKKENWETPCRMFDGMKVRRGIQTDEKEAFFFRKEEDFSAETVLGGDGTGQRWRLRYPAHMRCEGGILSATERGKAFFEKNGKYLYGEDE